MEQTVSLLSAVTGKSGEPLINIAAFHDAVIGEGSLPLSLLDAHIDRWIEVQSKGARTGR